MLCSLLATVGICFQISSAVKGMIGAMTRAMASKMAYMAVWALRRAVDAGGLVYSRSFKISR
jgi:hypothetical protein